MATCSKFAVINLKQLLGFQDLGVRGMNALRASHVEATQARWDIDGVFNTKLGIAANGASSIQITGTSKATDGLGHVLTISSAYKKDAPFQNTNAIVYHVGLMYAEIPAGLRINPRTGKPQFDQYVEEVGFAAPPTSVTDNGNGTITFNVNSVTEASVSNAGKLVRVYKLIPGDGCTTFAMALEECVVAYGSSNTITTVGKFGQTTVSTTAGDYVVVAMGPRIARATDLSTVPGVVYIGTVTGNNGTPSVFSTTNQTLFKTFYDASQVAYTPAGWLAPGATNVQSALDALVTGLQASTPSGAAAGSARVGVYAPDFDSIASGGIGNVADSTFTTSATLTNLGVALNNAIRRRQTFAVKNEGVNSAADESSGTSLANQIGGGGGGARAWWLRTLNNAGATPYSAGADTSGTQFGSYLFGEFNDPSQANPHLRKTRINATSNRGLSGGKWQRIWLDVVAGSYIRFGGTSQRYGLILEDFGANGGGFALEPHASPTSDDHGMFWRSGVIKPKDEATKGINASFRMGGLSGTNGWVWGAFQDLLVYGPSATQTSPAGAGFAFATTTHLNAAVSASTVSTQPRPLVFRDTVFVLQRTTDSTVVSLGGVQPIVFENCRFYGINSKAAGPLVTAVAGANVSFRDCVFYDPECDCIDLSAGVSGLMDNCFIVAGVGGVASLTTPSVIGLAANRYGFSVRDTVILLGSAAYRTTAAVLTAPLCVFGDTAIDGSLAIDNLLIKHESGIGMGWATVCAVSSQGVSGTRVDGLVLDLGGMSAPSLPAATLPWVTFTGAQNQELSVDHFRYANYTQTFSTAVAHNHVEVNSDVRGRHWSIPGPTSAVGVGSCNSNLRIAGARNSISGIYLENVANFSCSAGIIRVDGDKNSLDDIRDSTGSSPVQNTLSTTTAVSLLSVQGNDNKISRAHLTVHVGSNLAHRIASIIGRDNELTQSHLFYSGVPISAPVLFGTGRRHRFTNNTCHWNGTSVNFVDNSGASDSLFDALTFYRSSGSTAGMGTLGSGSVTGSTVTSTTL